MSSGFQMNEVGYIENITIVCAPQEEDKFEAERIGLRYNCARWSRNR
jgi:hypothetical protein